MASSSTPAAVWSTADLPWYVPMEYEPTFSSGFPSLSQYSSQENPTACTPTKSSSNGYGE